MTRCDGFTLIEILLANALGVVFLFGLSGYMVSMSSELHRAKQMTLILHDARFAIHYLNRQISKSGDSTCLDQVPSEAFIHGYSSQSANKQFRIKALKGTDVIMIARCQRYRQKIQWLKTLFYLAKTSRKAKFGKTVTAIFMKPIAGRREELAPHVVRFKVHYGSLNQLQLITAHQVKDWRAINSVLISFVMRTPERQLTKPPSYWFNGRLITAKDKHWYSVWQSYGVIRKRKSVQ